MTLVSNVTFMAANDYCVRKSRRIKTEWTNDELQLARNLLKLNTSCMVLKFKDEFCHFWTGAKRVDNKLVELENGTLILLSEYLVGQGTDHGSSRL